MFNFNATLGGTKWTLERRIYYWEILQCILAIVNFITSIWLTSYIGSRDLGVGGGLTVSVIVAGLTFILTLLGNWCWRHFSVYRKRRCVFLFMFFDLICIGLQIPALAVLSVAGLPSHCGGLSGGDDAADQAGEEQPEPGYTTIRFGNGGDSRGELDKYCNLPRSYFVLSIILLILYFYIISLKIRAMINLGRKARELRAQRKEADRVDQTNMIPIGHTSPTPVAAQNATAARLFPCGPHELPRHTVIPDDLEALDRTSSDGPRSWRDHNLPIDPPPYIPEQEVAKGTVDKK